MPRKKTQHAGDSSFRGLLAAIAMDVNSLTGISRGLSESMGVLNRQMTEARESANTCARVPGELLEQTRLSTSVLGELFEQAKLPFDQEWPTLRPTLELGTHLRQWPTIGHSLDQISSQISSLLESIGTFTQVCPPLDGITNINSIVEALGSPLWDMPPLPVIRLPRIDDKFIAQSATNDAITMLSPNASREERFAAWESMDFVVREWLHIDHQLHGGSGTHQVVNRGGEVTIYTPRDRDFAISNVLEMTAHELVFGRWQETDSPKDYLHVAVIREVRRYLNRQEKEQRLLQNVEGTDLEIVERLDAIVLDTKAEPVGDVSELIGELWPHDPEVNEIAIAKCVDGVPVADLAVHLCWPKRKTQSALKRMYRRIDKARSSRLRGSTALQCLRPPRTKRSGENIVLPTVPPKVGDFYCAGGTVRWERLDSGRHVWTHGTGKWLGIPFDKPKTS